MIVRIVQMTLEDDKADEFVTVFESRKHLIRTFLGCMHLELWQDELESNVFFTYSVWESDKHLDHYRFSPLFKEIWTTIKPMFAKKAQAWSMTQRMVV